MTDRFWAAILAVSGDPPADTASEATVPDSNPRCPSCGTPIGLPIGLTRGIGPDERVATPCGCRIHAVIRTRNRPGNE